MNSIGFTSDGDKIAGNLFPGGKPATVAFLFIQGWTGRQNTVAAQALADLGFTSMTYDMRGNGDSEGDLSKLSREDYVNDAVLAYDFLRQQVGEHVAIGVVGSSFGGYTAVLLSEQRPVACVSLRVPASYPDEGFNKPQLMQKDKSRDFLEWRSKQLGPGENRAFKALHDFSGKVQIIEAEADEILPHQVAENYVNAIRNKQQLDYTLMKGAPHSLVNEQLSSEYAGLLSRWAKQFNT
jgi:esterase/lipase